MGQKTDLALEKNKDQNKILVSELNQKIAQIKLGGGKSKLEKIRSQGKMTARERVDYLLDNGSENIEIGALAGYEMYEEEGGCPAAGVVVVMGYVAQKLCIVVANDASELGADDPAVVGAAADADDAPEPGAVTDPDAPSDAYAHRAVFALHVGHRVHRL